MNKFAIVLVTFSSYAAGWKEFTEPLAIPEPNKNGIYEFDLYFDFRLSMTTRQGYGFLQLVDYKMDTGKWIQRNNFLTTPCNDVLNTSANSTELLTLIQQFGLHRKTIAINGQSPGPPIVVPFGSEVLIRVHNNANEMSLHMHGLRNTWFNDGVAFLQQCPINGRSVYSYRFTADTPGTHWYHGHLGSDRAEGILGPLIIVPAVNENSTEDLLNATMSTGREYSVIIQHLSTMSAGDLNFAKYSGIGKWAYDYENTEDCWYDHNTYDMVRIGGSAPIAGILINEKGWHNQADLLSKPDLLPLETFRIRKGETIRLRLINAGISQAMMIRVQNHQMTLVAADGYEIQPVQPDYLILTPGERYDILITGQAQMTQKIHYLTVETLDYMAFNLTKISPTYGFSRLWYEDVDAAANKTIIPDVSLDFCKQRKAGCLVVNCPFRQFPVDMNMACLSAAELQALELTNDPTVLKSDGFKSGFQEHLMSLQFGNYIDGYNFKLPRSPPYFARDNENTVADWCDRDKCKTVTNTIHDDNCYCFYHLNISLNNIVQITIANIGPPGSRVGNGDAHPFHLHGLHFYLMKMAFPTYAGNNSVASINPDVSCAANAICNTPTWGNNSWQNGAIPEMNVQNPTLRDSVAIPVGGYIVIRFRATNPGWFFAHCHLLMHNMGGMAFAMRIGKHEEMPAPPANFPRACGIYEAPEGIGEHRPEPLGGQGTGIRASGILLLFACLFVYLL